MYVLLVASPSRITSRPEFFPYGLGLLAACLRRDGHVVRVFDGNLHRGVRDLTLFVRGLDRIDVVGLSGLITTFTFQVSAAAIVRARWPNALVVAGGGLATAAPELLLSRSAIDVVCVGEGEETFVNLLRSWPSASLREVDGVVFKEASSGSILRTSGAKPIADLDALPFPDWECADLPAYLPYSGFLRKGVRAAQFRRRADLTTTRGCPHRCSFCSNVFQRGAIRQRSVDSVLEEIDVLRERYQIDSIDFLDENFCYSRSRVFQLCTRLLEGDYRLAWGTAARATDVDREMLRLMKEAGCAFILYGFETGSQRILDRMGKGATVEQNWSAFRLTEEAGIHAHGNLIIGHPGEDEETLAESLSFQKRRFEWVRLASPRSHGEKESCDDVVSRFSTVSFCTPYPGSPLFEEVEDRIGDPASFLSRISHRDASELIVNLSTLSCEELLRWQRRLSDPSRWLDITRAVMGELRY